jgi:seryl-tRNA synthetase
MLDLAFVRDHLPLVEEKLRLRGMNPDIVLQDFLAIDQERRAAITEAETLKAKRNKVTEEIARLKKDKQDATALINETKEQREKIAEAEKRAEEADAKLRNILVHSRNSTSHPSRTGSWVKSWGYSTWSAPPKLRARALPSTGTWARGWSGR